MFLCQIKLKNWDLYVKPMYTHIQWMWYLSTVLDHLHNLVPTTSRNTYLHQSHNVDVVQFFKDGYFLVNSFQRSKHFRLLSLSCFWSSWGRATCKTTHKKKKTKSNNLIMISQKYGNIYMSNLLNHIFLALIQI